MKKPPTFVAGGALRYTHTRFYVTCGDESTPGKTCPECWRPYDGPRRLCDDCAVEYAEALKRRRSAAFRLPPLANGKRDPWTVKR